MDEDRKEPLPSHKALRQLNIDIVKHTAKQQRGAVGKEHEGDKMIQLSINTVIC